MNNRKRSIVGNLKLTLRKILKWISQICWETILD